MKLIICLSILVAASLGEEYSPGHFGGHSLYVGHGFGHPAVHVGHRFVHPGLHGVYGYANLLFMEYMDMKNLPHMEYSDMYNLLLTEYLDMLNLASTVLDKGTSRVGPPAASSLPHSRGAESACGRAGVTGSSLGDMDNGRDGPGPSFASKENEVRCWERGEFSNERSARLGVEV